MNERIVSRVTAVTMFCSGPLRPWSGSRNGTRTSALPSCWARPNTSTAAIGTDAVATSGRLPIAIRDPTGRPTGPIRRAPPGDL